MKIKKENIDPYFINPAKEKRLWETAVFVFDSSAILDFYYLPKQTREKIYKEIFEVITERLWIPFMLNLSF